MAEKLNPFALGAAVGIVWGAAVFLYAVGAAYCGYGKEFVVVLSSIYPGYGATLGGAAIGALYGFADGLIAYYVVALLYNLLVAKEAKGKKKR